MSNKDKWWDSILVGVEPRTIAQKIHEEVAAGRAERDALRAENKRMKEMYANEAYKRNVLQGEWHDLRARVAELERLVESAYAEGFYRAQQGGVDWNNRPNEWKGSHAHAALAGKQPQEGE